MSIDLQKDDSVLNQDSKQPMWSMDVAVPFAKGLCCAAPIVLAKGSGARGRLYFYDGLVVKLIQIQGIQTLLCTGAYTLRLATIVSGSAPGQQLILAAGLQSSSVSGSKSLLSSAPTYRQALPLRWHLHLKLVSDEFQPGVMKFAGSRQLHLFLAHGTSFQSAKTVRHPLATCLENFVVVKC